MPRYWSVEAAKAALREVIPLLQELQAIVRQARASRAAPAPQPAQQPPSVNGHGSVAGPPAAALEDQERRVLERLNEMGVQVKDLNSGLIDFPYSRDGEEVLLCYRLGEPDIEYWHNISSGFAGRRPLSEL